MDSLRKRLEAKRKNLNQKGKSGKVIFLKEDETLRVRILPVGENREFCFEVTQFYLGSDIKGVYSMATVGKPCPIQEKYEELKNSKDPDDKAIAKELVPKRKYLMPVLVYKDLKGREIDTEQSGKFIQITGDIYQQIIDLFLDDADWGDPTDPDEGYDLKIGRTGSGKTDTKYSCNPCPKSKLAKEWKKVFDIDEKIEDVLEPYDSALEKLQQFLGEDVFPEGGPKGKKKKEEDDEDEDPKARRERRKRERENTDE